MSNGGLLFCDRTGQVWHHQGEHSVRVADSVNGLKLKVLSENEFDVQELHLHPPQLKKVGKLPLQTKKQAISTEQLRNCSEFLMKAMDWANKACKRNKLAEIAGEEARAHAFRGFLLLRDGKTKEGLEDLVRGCKASRILAPTIEGFDQYAEQVKTLSKKSKGRFFIALSGIQKLFRDYFIALTWPEPLDFAMRAVPFEE